MKKLSLEEEIKKYRLESDKYAFDAEKKENLELLQFSNGLKRVAEKKQAELSAVLGKRKCLIEKKKNNLIDNFFTYHCFLFEFL